MLINRASCSVFRAALGHESAGVVNGPGLRLRGAPIGRDGLRISGGAPIFDLRARSGVLAILRSINCRSGDGPDPRNLREQDHVLADASQRDAAEIVLAGRRRVLEGGQRRDRAADGTFFYSVRTTGVFCRPSCAARLPRRENVAFHKTCADAERAGFRPCKRCRPNEPTLAETHAAAVARACRRIEETEEAPSLETLAQSADMSRYHFHPVFKPGTGGTPKAYAPGPR